MLDAEREQVATLCRKLASDGLVTGTSGNVSVRSGNLVAVSPTGATLASLEAESVAVVDGNADLIHGGLAPTSELELHLGIYERFGAGAVVHTHAPMATAISCVLDELPCVHYEMMLLGGPVRVAPYETFGTSELAAAALRALEGRTAALLSNHGTLAYGFDAAGALRATEVLEWASTVYWRAAALGAPRTLDERARQAVLDAAAARSYGSTHNAHSRGGESS